MKRKLFSSPFVIASAGALAVLGFVLARGAVPELIRYLRIRRM